MGKYKTKPVFIEASRWFKGGDHPIVQRYIAPDTDGQGKCNRCDYVMNEHGWINTEKVIGAPEDGYIVCPGDWIIKDVHGRYYPADPVYFEQVYEKV